MRTEYSKNIEKFLKEDLLINLNILGIIENEPNAEIYVDNIENPKCVLAKNGYFNFLYAKDEAMLEELIESFDREGHYGFGGAEKSIADKIKQRYKVDWSNPCTLYCLPKENLDLSKIKNEVKDVDIKDAETIDYYYTFRSEKSLEEIKEDILNRPSSAIYKDGEIVCWVLTHDDNSLGIMYTKEEHRRKGYAVDVTLDIAAKHIANGKVPFLHILEDNAMSPGLAKECGFVECGKVDWFGISVGNPT
jgi:hypothetical protein